MELSSLINLPNISDPILSKTLDRGLIHRGANRRAFPKFISGEGFPIIFDDQHRPSNWVSVFSLIKKPSDRLISYQRIM
jgi:hypothetical protein